MAKNFKGWLNQELKDLRGGFYIYPKRKILFLVLGVFFGLLAFFKFWLATKDGALSDFDNLFIEKISYFKTPFLDNFFFLVTQLGSRYFIIAIFLILSIFLFKKRGRRAATTVFFTLLGSYLAIFFLKESFNRLRPDGCPLNDPSFPSGHAASAFYFYGTLFSLATRFIKLKKREVLVLGLGLGLLILLIAFSRIYLGCHYPSDILGGFILGGIWVLIAAILIDFFYK